MATQFTPFDVGALSDQKLRDVAFVKDKFSEATQAVKVRDAEIQRLTASQQGVQSQLKEATAALLLRESELASMRQALANQTSLVQELRDKLAKVQVDVPRIKVQDLVGQFKTHIDRINTDVITQKATGMLIDHVEVEVRGGIDVRDGLHLSPVAGAALSADSVSTLKFNLRPATALRIVDDEDEPQRPA